MTEADWLAATDPGAMFWYVRSRANKRKVRLYLCGGCRAISHLLYSPHSLDAVEVSERFADGLATEEEVGAAAWGAEVPTFGFDFDENHLREFERDVGPNSVMRETHERLVEMGAISESSLTGGEWRVNETVRRRLAGAAGIAHYCACGGLPDLDGFHEVFTAVDWPGRWMVDCVFGNPFRPVAFDPDWLTSTVTALAAGVYADRAFDRLPILADALEEAGCGDPAVLSHCRSPGPHARGCWVVDGVLGRG